MGKKRTTGEAVKTAERRAFVLAMRKTGATYRKIAAAAATRFGVDNLPDTWGERYAHKDLVREIERLQEETGEDAILILNIEIERLDRLTEALWPRAIAGEDSAVDRLLKIMERRAKYLDLDSKIKFEITHPQKTILEIRYEDGTSEEDVQLSS